MDYLVVGNFMLAKEGQTPWHEKERKRKDMLD